MAQQLSLLNKINKIDMKALAIVGGALAGAVVAAVLTLDEKEKNAVSKVYDRAKEKAEGLVETLKEESGSLNLKSLTSLVAGKTEGRGADKSVGRQKGYREPAAKTRSTGSRLTGAQKNKRSRASK